MENSRINNTKRNIFSGVMRQCINIILPFIIRTIIIYTLGEAYQGLSSLFTSILQVLSLTDLGFTTAVVYVLYRPIADNDQEKICAIMAYLKKIYFIIGLAILGIGLAIIPFLENLIAGDYPQDINIYVLYVIYLLNSVVSYWFFAYKNTLLTAMQREDIVNNIYSCVSIALKLIQIAVLLLVKNYYVYVIFIPLSTVVNNLLLNYYSNRCFPKIKPDGAISKDTKQELTKQVKGVFINRIGDVARNGTDSIFVSAFLGLTAVAVYDNYYYIYSAIYGLTLMITHAMQASVGNSIARESKQKNYIDLSKFNFIFSWLCGWCAICMCCLYQPFMHIWMNGEKTMLLTNVDMVLFCLYFYAITMNNMRNLYVSGAGLYWELRKWYIFEAVGNIVLNWLLGYLFGMTGIIVATIITIFVFNFIARTNVLFKCYFKFSPRRFFANHLLCFVVALLNCVATYLICSAVTVEGIAGFVFKALICAVLPNVLFFVAYFKTQQFRKSISFVKTVIKR